MSDLILALASGALIAAIGWRLDRRRSQTARARLTGTLAIVASASALAIGLVL